MARIGFRPPISRQAEGYADGKPSSSRIDFRLLIKIWRNSTFRSTSSECTHFHRVTHQLDDAQYWIDRFDQHITCRELGMSECLRYVVDRAGRNSSALEQFAPVRCR